VVVFYRSIFSLLFIFHILTTVVFLYTLAPGFSIDRNFQDVMTSRLKNLDVSVQNLEVMQ